MFFDICVTSNGISHYGLNNYDHGQKGVIYFLIATFYYYAMSVPKCCYCNEKAFVVEVVTSKQILRITRFPKLALKPEKALGDLKL